MDILYKVYFFVFGSLIGSFLNVVILRLPKNEDLVFKPSHCSSCGVRLKWYHNLPIVSYLILKGKCGFCGEKISIQYPVIEFLIGLIAFLLAPNVINLQALGLFSFYFMIACIFICHLIIDIRYHLLLDSLNLYLLAIVLPFSIIHFHWTHIVLGGIIGFGFPLLVTWLFYKLRGQVGLGGGDIKLFGILGLFAGPTGVMWLIFLSCFVGALVGIIMIMFKKLSRDKPMAFGPAILFITSIYIFFPAYFQKFEQFLLD